MTTRITWLSDYCVWRNKNSRKLVKMQKHINLVVLLFSCNRMRLSHVNSAWMVLWMCLAFNFWLCNIWQHEFSRNNFATEFRQISSIGIWLAFYGELDGFHNWEDLLFRSGMNVLDLFIYYFQPEKLFLWLPNWLFKNL